MKGAYIAIIDFNGVYIVISTNRGQTFTRLQPINCFTNFSQPSSISF